MTGCRLAADWLLTDSDWLATDWCLAIDRRLAGDGLVTGLPVGGLLTACQLPATGPCEPRKHSKRFESGGHLSVGVCVRCMHA